MTLALTKHKDNKYGDGNQDDYYKVNKKKKYNTTIKDLREEKEKESSYLVYHQNGFNKAETKVVDYLLTDETMYTSIEKAEGLYLTRIEEKKKKLDALTLFANKLKGEELFLSSRISEETVTNIVNDTDLIEKQYQNRIEPLYPEIEALNHSLQVYRNQKEELIQENIRLKQQMNDEYKQSRFRNEQLNKFNIIDNSIKSESAMKEKLFNTMTTFGFKSLRMYKDKEEKKKHQYALKELELAQFKEDAIEMERKLNRIRQKRQCKERILPEEDYKNRKFYSDNSALRKENNLNLIKLEAIKKNLEVKDLDTAIVHFKEQSIKYESSYNQYNKLMKELAELQGIYSKESIELKKTQDMIDLKLNQDNLIVDPIIIELQKENNEKTEEIALVTQKCDSMELFIKKIFIFINAHQENTIPIMKSILINSAKLTVFNLSSIDDIIKTYFDNKDLITDLKRFTTIKRFERKDFPIILQCILKYLRTWHVINFNFIVEMAMHYCYVSNPDAMKRNEFLEFIVTDFDDQNYETQIKQKRNKNYNDKLADKKRIMNGIIQSEKQLDQMNFDISKSNKKTTIQELFNRFLTHFNRQMSEKEEMYTELKKNDKQKEIIDEKESMDILVSKLNHKFFIRLSGYVNELVEKYQKPKLDYSRLNLTNSALPNPRSLKRKQTVMEGIMDLLWKNAALKDKKNQDELEESYHEDIQKPMHASKKSHESSFYKSLYTHPDVTSPNMTMFNRSNDIHKLNFEMFHNQSNQRVYAEISSVCGNTMSSKSFYKLMKQSKSKKKAKNRFDNPKKQKTTIWNNRIETMENNRTTVSNEKVNYLRIPKKKVSHANE